MDVIDTSMGKALAVALVFASALVAGCAATEDVRPGAQNPRTVTQSLNLSGYPPEFQRGFREGCNAARARESAKPKTGDQYALGWNDGFDYCSPRK